VAIVSAVSEYIVGSPTREVLIGLVSVVVLDRRRQLLPASTTRA
jgi:hypothetical protein